MNRKNFLTSVLGLSAMSVARWRDRGPLLIPPYLKPGDTIGITCPAGDITEKEIQPAIQLIESWGFRTLTGSTVGKKDFIYGGTDAERLADFQQMLDNPDVRAILCARGGYGSVHIVDQLNFSSLLNTPNG